MSFVHHFIHLKLITPAFLLTLLLSLSRNCVAQPPTECQCLWQGSFSEAYTRADAVVIAEVISGKGNSFDIKIEDRLTDASNSIPEFLDTVRVWANNGKLCRPEVATFPAGTRWVMALNKIDQVPAGGFDPATPNISFGRKNDFYLSQCGSFWLRVEGSVAIGNLVSERRWSWKDDDSRPVSVSILKQYLGGNISAARLKQEAQTPEQLLQLRQQTREFLQQQ